LLPVIFRFLHAHLSRRAARAASLKSAAARISRRGIYRNGETGPRDTGFATYPRAREACIDPVTSRPIAGSPVTPTGHHMHDDAGTTGRWMTYDELAEMRGIKRIGAVRLVQRYKWRRQAGNDGRARVLVPHEPWHQCEAPMPAAVPPCTSPPPVPAMVRAPMPAPC
jgi:hypothetical protein